MFQYARFSVFASILGYNVRLTFIAGFLSTDGNGRKHGIALCFHTRPKQKQTSKRNDLRLEVCRNI
jgi:hypothetical protein